MKKQQGFSLTELLCSVVIGLICITAITELFIEYRKIHKLETASAEIQENAVFAANILQAKIESAGLIGCRKLSNNLPITNVDVKPINQLMFNNDIKIFSGENSKIIPPLPPYLKIAPKKNTDVILVRHMSNITGHLLEPLYKSNSLFVELNPKFKKDTDIVISDCTHAVLAHLKKISRYQSKEYQHLTVAKKVKQSFNTNAEAGQLETSIFFIGRTKRKNLSGKTIYALYEMNENGTKSELVSNIISLKANCLINNNGVLKYEAPKAIHNWADVYALQIKLLLISENFNHKYNNEQLHKTFQFIVPLREHIL